MSADRSFQERVEEIVTTAERERESRRQALSSEMTERDTLAEAFGRAAARVQEELVQPRVAAVARHFDNAHVEELRTPAGVHSRCTFKRTDQYPASVALTVGVLRDPDRAVASVFCRVEIVPELGEFEKGTYNDVAVDALERGAADGEVAGFLDDALLRFLASYLRLEVSPLYQKVATTRDPVCGMTITAADAGASVDHSRHRYYFCSTTCRDKFVASPDAYLRDGVAPRA
jgi:YHS domain-containing protein